MMKIRLKIVRTLYNWNINGMSYSNVFFFWVYKGIKTIKVKNADSNKNDG